MEKILFVFFLLSINLEITAQSGWTIVPVGTGALLTEISLTGVSTAFISSSGGIVMKTTNGGTNWISQKIIANEDLTTIHFPSASIGYTASSEGKIFKTNNAGINWTPTISPVSREILKIYFIDDNTGFISTGPANDGRIFKTTNGGNNWTENGPAAAFPEMLSINFPDPNAGYASGRNGVILKSSDAGENWNITPTGFSSGDLFSIFFTDENTGYAVSPFPQYMIKTTNGGVSWNTIYNNPDHFVVLLNFPSRDTGFAVGGAAISTVILKTTNAGINWNSEIIDYDGHANDIEFINNNTGYIVGEFGRVYKTTNGGAQVGINQNQENVPDGFVLYQNYPNPFNPGTTISYELQVAGLINLKIYNLRGIKMADLINEKQNAGYHTFEFTGADFPSGIYIYQLTYVSKGNVITEAKRMILIK